MHTYQTHRNRTPADGYSVNQKLNSRANGNRCKEHPDREKPRFAVSFAVHGSDDDAHKKIYERDAEVHWGNFFTVIDVIFVDREYDRFKQIDNYAADTDNSRSAYLQCRLLDVLDIVEKPQIHIHTP